MNVEKEDTNVRVAVRCRPMNGRETAMATTKCVSLESKELSITGPGGENHSFGFDIILDEDSLQSEMWDHVGTPILEKAFSGYNGTIFAYGQTGSGKTWSMQGGKEDLEGVIPRMNKSLFERIDALRTQFSTLHFLVTVSYFELYNEVIFDLLDVNDRKKKRMGLEIKEHPVLGVYVKGLKEIVVDCPEKIQGIVDQGMKNRTVATTQMNADSSRSHSVFTIKIHQKDSEDESKNLFAKVNLVDLAGSERVKSTGASGATLKEGANINKSLSALGNVINALVEQAKNPKKCPFIPYRNSKLTRVLQESLGGNSITVMIAALSPALCNFEETLSTLKYANRAKAIKVRAVKNDESSQVGRLNEEIQALKDKLLLQASTVDTSLLEEKHQQQLRDLEEAMKSTWEEKARISQAHENDRKLLLKEQAEAENKLSIHQENNWKLLEEKGDLGLSIGRVGELFGGITQSVTEPDVTIAWSSDLRDILKLEDRLSQQDTVVEVYKAALHADGSRFILHSNHEIPSSTGDQYSQTIGLPEERESSSGKRTVPMGLWKQLREKFYALCKELGKWQLIRDELGSLMNSFAASITHVHDAWSLHCQVEKERRDCSELYRGLKLLLNQTKVKNNAFSSCSNRVENVALSFKLMASAMLGILHERKEVLAGEGGEVDAEDNDTSCKRKGIMQEMDKCMQKIQVAFELSHHSHTVEVIDYVASSMGHGVINPVANGSDPWVFSRDANGRDEPLCLEVIFPERVELASINIQGGHVIIGATPSSEEGVSLSSLPCGLCIGDCDGSIDKTVLALGDVISWEKITKKNSPETFLKRPPVRFLFDVINAVEAVSRTSMFESVEDSSSFKDWGAVGATKESKVLFMDTVLTYVSTAIHIPAPTTANAIVTGTNSELTNVFLQHLSIVAFMSIKGVSLPPPEPPSAKNGGNSHRRGTAVWLDELKVAWSEDGSMFSNSSEVMTTNLQDATALKTIHASDLNVSGNVQIKSLRIYPLKWKGSMSSLRMSLLTYISQEKSAYSTSDTSGHKIDSLKYINDLTLLGKTTDILAVATDHITKLKDLAESQRQEEAMKKMESIVDEKIAQEQALLDEKLALNSEKSSLEEQLQEVKEKMLEMEKAVVREKSYRLQLETVRKSLDEEKRELQVSLQEQDEAISDVQTQMLKMQAAAERDSKLVGMLRKKGEDDQHEIESLSAELRNLKNEMEGWQADREDLVNQVEVLTEERDDARRNEEELFDDLGERTNDLEKLQESYVNMTDRCNDYQDDISDLQENILSLKSLVNQAPIFLKDNAPDEKMLTSRSSPKILSSDELVEQGSGNVTHTETEGLNNDSYEEEFEDDFEE